VSRRQYDEDFKRNAVELLLNGSHDLKPLAQELGICPSTLRYWRDAYLRGNMDSQAPPRGPTPLETAEELRRLRLENDKLRRQREILKKALSILSEQSPGSMP
jgi:transposase